MRTTGISRQTMSSRSENQSKSNPGGARTAPPPKQGLYDPQFEHDACGVGFVVNIKGKKSHAIVEQALQVLLNLDHRGACGCEANTGDGAGILMQMPHEFLKVATAKSGFKLPGAGPIRRRHGVHAARIAQRARDGESDVREHRCRGRPARPRLARHSDEQCVARRDRQGRPSRSCGRCSSGAIATVDRRPGVRAQALRHPQAGGATQSATAERSRAATGFTFPACRARRSFTRACCMPEQVAKYYPDLRDPGDGIGAGAGAFAVFHEHVSELGPRASVSLHRAQRRNQHAPRQHQLDARRAVEFRLRLVRRRHQENPAGHQHRRQRLGDVRQLPRIARHGGPRIAARDDDDDSRAVGKPREHGSGDGARFTNIIPA